MARIDKRQALIANRGSGCHDTVVIVSRSFAVLPLALLAPIGAMQAAAAPAYTATCTSTSALCTYNRPATVGVPGGAVYLAWADVGSAGAIHVALLKDRSAQDGTATAGSWTDPKSTTFYGTSPSVQLGNGAIIVAWSNLNGQVTLAEPDSAGGLCETRPGVTSYQTPFLTTEGAYGAGSSYLTWVASDGTMHIDKLSIPTLSQCNAGGSFAISEVAHITTDTSWDGPALAISGYGSGSEDYWLMWAGTDSGHHLNVAEYSSSWNRLGKTTEPAHSTLTDMGGMSTSNEVWMTYCGTNNLVYYQAWQAGSGTGGAGRVGRFNSGSRCSVTTFTTGGNTYYSGGVDISAIGNCCGVEVAWADKNLTIISGGY